MQRKKDIYYFKTRGKTNEQRTNIGKRTIFKVYRLFQGMQK